MYREPLHCYTFTINGVQVERYFQHHGDAINSAVMDSQVTQVVDEMGFVIYSVDKFPPILSLLIIILLAGFCWAAIYCLWTFYK